MIPPRVAKIPIIPVSHLFSSTKTFGLTPLKIATFGFLALITAFFEGFGLAMFLPLLQFIEKQGDLSVLAHGSRVWPFLMAFFQMLHLPITLIGLVGIVMTLIFCRVLCIYFRQTYTAWLSQDILHTTRTKIFTSCLNASYGYLDSMNTGNLLNLATTEAIRVRAYFQSIFECSAHSVVVTGYILVLLWLSTSMTLMAVIILATAGVVVGYQVRHTKRLSLKTRDRNKEFSSQLVERLGAFRLIKLTATEKREIDGLSKSSDQVRQFNFWLAKLNARVDLFLEPMVVVGGLAILYLAVVTLRLSLPQIGLFMLVLLRILPLSKEIMKSRQNFLANSGGLIAVQEGLAVMDQAKEDNPGTTPFTRLSRDIRFEHVTFTYPSQPNPAIQDLSITIPAGKMTALVGPSGAGKSTFIDLLAGLRLPQTGRILFDGVPMEDYALHSLRQGMAFVSQDTFIFNDTIRNNLAFIRPEASEADIKKAMDQALVSEFVDRLPQGWDTVLGERGTRLSGGQKQRLSLARALLQRAPILVLDEATSALDSEKEMDIQAAIRDLRGEGRVTLVVIAHRLSTIREADTIIVLDQGRVVEQGPHSKLMHNAEWYARVSSLQTGAI